MATQATLGKGATWAGPGSATLSEITSIRWPSPKNSEVDVTHLLTPGLKRDYISGLETTTDYSISGNYVADNFTSCESQRGVTGTFTMVDPLGDVTVTHEGFIKGVEAEHTPDKQSTITVTVQVTGGVNTSG